MLDATHFGESSFELGWPRAVFAAELARLLRRMGAAPSGRQVNDGLSISARHSEAELLLDEAFVHDGPKEEFNLLNLDGLFGSESGSSPDEWLTALHRHVDVLPVPGSRPAYWSQRRLGRVDKQRRKELPETARRFADLIERYEQRGYLAQAFGEDCVDGSSDGTLGSSPTDEVHGQLGRDGLWPPSQNWRSYDLDALCDVIEFAHDHVSRPNHRWYHQFSSCGWHHGRYHAERGRQLYRDQVNQLLGESVLPLSLNEQGRLEQVAPDELEALIAAARAESGPAASELHHAFAQFRARGATILDRRSAVVTLAGILESRRNEILKRRLAQRDEADIFEIANKFGIRHQRADQKTNYNQDLYLEWIFYWYVATVHLTDKILSQTGEAAEA
jgi:hypothetical protein